MGSCVERNQKKIHHDELIASVLKAPRIRDMKNTSWVGFRWSKFSSYNWIKFYRGKICLKKVVYRATGKGVIKRCKAKSGGLGREGQSGCVGVIDLCIRVLKKGIHAG